ncbi:MAG: TetR/AcrR family transcriptional regulator [Acidobacteria bacterium]|nr:MAG: TetR/AcrR family transcriptional regulator [Acidobacteriota bacterium]REK07961.1 MAG: TetR/AcrR family transcriptional regulator [Acidobacteriota bacterium]
MGTPADSEKARSRLEEAAREVFAEHGYQGATVREICRRAGQNPSSINYHFGTKEDLYRKILRQVGPPEDAPPVALIEEASPRQRLRAFIAYFLAETLGGEEQPWKARVMAHEFAAPTPLLDELVQGAIRPHFEMLHATVAELLGVAGDRTAPIDQLVTDHAFGVVSQVVFYRHSRPVVERVARRRYGATDMERLADHIARAVLAAIAADRRRVAACTRQRRAEAEEVAG